MVPIVSKMFCSSSQVCLVVRRRPHVVNGGGFVVIDGNQNVLFRVDGCGVLGTKGELILRDGDGEPLLLICKKGGMVQAISIHREWKGYTFDYEGLKKSVFTLKDPKPCFANNIQIKVTTQPRMCKKDWDFEIKGYFPNRDCSIVDHTGNVVAQVGVRKELMASKDVYYVVVKPSIDQVFVIGIIAVLDYIYGESTRC